jgi:hypothetical protein
MAWTRRAAAAVLVGGLLLAGACSGCDSPSDSGSGSGGTASGPSGGSGAGGTGQQNCVASGRSPSAAAAGAVPAAGDAQTTVTAVAKTQAFLATLSADQKKSVMYDYTALDAKRCSWSNFPDGLFNGRLGLKLGDLTEAQRAAALAALQSVSSADGYVQFHNQMLGDDQLATQGGPGNMGRANYHIVLFGPPSTSQPWTLQFGGHHLAVHVTLGGGALSVSPHYSGAQPISFTSGGQTIRPMGQETDNIFALFSSLTADQQGAKLSGRYDDILMGPGTDTGYPAQEGLSYTRLDDTQKNLVKALIGNWVGDAAAAYAKPLTDLYTSQLDQTTIAYAGTVDPRSETAYFRIDGPRVWIEWINTAAAGFHYHTVYRDKKLDYGTGTG